MKKIINGKGGVKVKKIIDGKVYDTEKARKLATSEFGELYEKRTKEYFVHVVDKIINFEEIKPITKEQAERWLDEVAEDFTPFG